MVTMTTDVEIPDTTTPEPVLIQRGRYALSELPDGSWSIRRAVPICERCESCGCGEQQDEIILPAMLVPFITGQSSMSPGGAMKMLKQMMGGNGNGK